MSEITFEYWQSFTFSPNSLDYLDSPIVPGRSLTMTEDRRTILMPRNMFAGPVRFEVMVDVDEAECAARFGPHDRFEGDFRGEACGYALQDMNHFVPVLDALQPGEYRAIVLRSGVEAADFDNVCEESNERYLLILQAKS